MSDDTPEDAIERGLEAYFAGDTITDLLEGIDIDALAEGDALGDAVEYEQLGKVLGALIGRAAVKGASSSGLLGRFVKESLGSEVGGRVGEAVTAALIETGNTEALTGQLRSLTNSAELDRLGEEIGEAIVGADDEFEADWTEIEVEDESNE
jgi:hypothetical protein